MNQCEAAGQEFTLTIPGLSPLCAQVKSRLRSQTSTWNLQNSSRSKLATTCKVIDPTDFGPRSPKRNRRRDGEIFRQHADVHESSVSNLDRRKESTAP